MASFVDFVAKLRRPFKVRAYQPGNEDDPLATKGKPESKQVSFKSAFVARVVADWTSFGFPMLLLFDPDSGAAVLMFAYGKCKFVQSSKYNPG